MRRHDRDLYPELWVVHDRGPPFRSGAATPHCEQQLPSVAEARQTWCAGCGLVGKVRQRNPALWRLECRPGRSAASDKALRQALQKDVPGQVDADEDQLVLAGLAG